MAQGHREGFHNLTSEMSRCPRCTERQETLAAEPMILYFTSGTTRYPKAVMHDHTYSLAHILTAKYWQQVQDPAASTHRGRDRLGKPPGASSRAVGSAAALRWSSTSDKFDPRHGLWPSSNRYAVTTFCAPPTVPPTS